MSVSNGLRNGLSNRGLLVVALACLFMLLAPPYLTDKVWGVVTFATAERQCFNFHKERFRNPRSAYLSHSHLATEESQSYRPAHAREPLLEDYDEVVFISVQAKNGYGAYGTEVLKCPLVKGRFDETTARVERLNGRLDPPLP